jgi:hypothetical protein
MFSGTSEIPEYFRLNCGMLYYITFRYYPQSTEKKAIYRNNPAVGGHFSQARSRTIFWSEVGWVKNRGSYGALYCISWVSSIDICWTLELSETALRAEISSRLWPGVSIETQFVTRSQSGRECWKTMARYSEMEAIEHVDNGVRVINLLAWLIV